MSTQTHNPILLIIFNRPDTTRQVFESIRAEKPIKLYVAADGPRRGREGEAQRCRQTREITHQVDWDCQVFRLFREENLGCKYAVSSAISWFFENEPQGIILEDDCLPDPSFFRYCDELLEYYRHNNKIMAICGSNFLNNAWAPETSYYFSNYNHVWGWATWRRAWQKYDLEMTSWPEFINNNGLETIFPNKWSVKTFWYMLLSGVAAGKVDTWDYQWLYSIWANNGCSIIPRTNLVKNIGFDADATHTTGMPQWIKEMKSTSLTFPMKQPAETSKSLEAESDYEKTVLDIRAFRMIRKYIKFLFRSKIKTTLINWSS